MADLTNILLVGVGGQGTILASRVLAEVALQEGKDLKLSEIHGMAQRGGSVVTHVRFGKHVYSPLISQGQADFLVSFEKLEALRFLPYLKKEGWLIINDQEIPPLPTLLGKADYPSDIFPVLREKTERLQTIPALRIAQEIGNPRVVNAIVLGVLARHLSVDQKIWEQALASCVRSEFQDINITAFRKGLNWSGN